MLMESKHVLEFWLISMPVALSAVVCLFAARLDASPAPPPSAPRHDAWIVIGPGGGGAQFHPAINPHDPKKILVNSDMTCSFVSEDGGSSWRMFNLRSPVRLFAWDPLDPKTAYAQTIGLFRTTDAGSTWSLVYPNPSDVKSLIHRGDHGEDVLVTDGSPVEEISALAIDPADSKKLYAAMGAALFSSSDWGKTWRKDAGLSDGCQLICVDPKSARADRTLYIIGAKSVSVREAGKWTEHKGPEGVTRFNTVSAAFPKAGGMPVIYGISGRGWRAAGGVLGAFVSRDGGATWANSAAALAEAIGASESALQFQAVAAAPGVPGVAYVSYRTSGRGSSSAPRLIGVARTDNGGKTWNAVWKDVGETPGANIKDAWLNERYGPDWGENPFNLDVAATSPDICFGTDFGRTMRTTDGGKTWEGVYSKRMSDGGWSTTGLDVSCCYAVHFDPFDAKRMFISYTDIGLFRSETGGSSWLSATDNGVPREWTNACYWVEFDPKVKGLAWAVMSDIHDLPRPKMWRRDGEMSQNGGVMVSTDGGKSWAVTSADIGPATATHILLDPTSPVGGRTLYMCAFGRGVFKSTDNGKTWAAKNDGIDIKAPLAWRITRAGDGTLYLVVFRKTEDGSIGNDGDGALYRSTDGAEHWQKVALPDGVNGPAGIEVDPKDAKALCLAAWGRVNDKGDTGGGVFISADAGKTWKNTLSKDQHIHDVSIDPRNNVYYACGFESNAWRSDDKGQTWTRLKGYNFKWGRRVVPDPQNPDMVFISTFGGSVWYGPAKGDPKAVEDIVTPEVAYTR
jgi:photosystem II stability/assembly factor-like uncharacterized protein